MNSPEDNPADDVQPTEAEWDEFERERQAASERKIIGCARWTCPNGDRATERCVNGTFFTREHLLSDDGTKCLACGALRTDMRKP